MVHSASGSQLGSMKHLAHECERWLGNRLLEQEIGKLDIEQALPMLEKLEAAASETREGFYAALVHFTRHADFQQWLKEHPDMAEKLADSADLALGVQRKTAA